MMADTFPENVISQIILNLWHCEEGYVNFNNKQKGLTSHVSQN